MNYNKDIAEAKTTDYNFESLANFLNEEFGHPIENMAFKTVEKEWSEEIDTSKIRIVVYNEPVPAFLRETKTPKA